MAGPFSWLGGRCDPKAEAASVHRARAHRRNTAKTDRAAQAWEAKDRRRYGA